MAKRAGKKIVPGDEAADVPPDYKAWAWPVLRPRTAELIEHGAKHAKRWLKHHRRAARIPELLASDKPTQTSRDADDELNKCAIALATDAFLAIYFAHQPLKRGKDPKAHLCSVINSIGANRLRSHDNWLRALHSDSAENLGDLISASDPEDDSSSGKRLATDRIHQRRMAERLKATLPLEWQFERALVEVVGEKGLRNRKALAAALDTTLEHVQAGLDRILQHTTSTRPALKDAIFELARSAVPAATIRAPSNGRNDPRT